MRERSARKTSVFNQKTMFLGYAHSSCYNCLPRARFARAGRGNVVHFSAKPKNEQPLLLSLCEQNARS
ncbi:MAG: hypothetical protein U5L45_09415 [Saprospiraceae bacterium]|nr:hypothetical protein [Saprospiraceae bacterium]